MERPGENVLDLNNRALRGTALEALLKAVLADGTRIDDLEIAYPHARQGGSSPFGERAPVGFGENTWAGAFSFRRHHGPQASRGGALPRLFEAARDGIIIVDASTGKITDVNPFIEQLCGYRREELVGEKFGTSSRWRARRTSGPLSTRFAIRV